MNRLWLALLPDLRSFAPAERAHALREARSTSLDAPELLGLATGLVGVIAFTRLVLAAATPASPFGMAALDLGVALPLLALLLGPVHLRRLRRGLRQQIERRPAR